MWAELRFLHVPSSDTNVLPSFILQVGPERYLFNVGEGTSRSSTQRKSGLTRVSNIFVPRIGWEAIGGLPGALMSIADGQRHEETVYGPTGLRYALATMRTYAKRDNMKLTVRELDSDAPSNPIHQDDNLAIHAIQLLPSASTATPTLKKAKLDLDVPRKVDAATLAEVDQMWRKSRFEPTNLPSHQAEAWIQLIADCMFNDGLRQNGARASGPLDTEAGPSNGHSQWKAPLSPAFVNKMLPYPFADRIVRSKDRSDPAEGGQAPVLAFICEANSQRGKFDNRKASDAGVPLGRDFATLAEGADITIKRPVAWHTMTAQERKSWSLRNRKGKTQAKTKQPADVVIADAAPTVELEDVLLKSSDFVGPSRAGAVVFQLYLPSVDYIDSLVSDKAASAAFDPYTWEKNKHLSPEQYRTPHVIVHAAPIEVLQDERYQIWMQQFGPHCHHILANRAVCSNRLMFPSSATIPLRLSKLDPVMFEVPQYQLEPRTDPAALFDPLKKLKITAARANMSIQLHPRSDPEQALSDAPEFDWPINSLQAEQLASFDVEPVVEVEVPSAKKGAKAVKVEDVPISKNLRLHEGRKKAWSEYLDVVEQIRSTNPSSKAASVAPKDDVLVTTLGTGSAAPSKYRNVISTLVQTPTSGNILLDAGEATYGLLRRKFGCHRDGTANQIDSLKGEDVDQILENLRVLFISHIHADHHIGLIRLLVERRKLSNRPKHPLYLVGTAFVQSYLQEYSKIELLGLDEDVFVLVNEHLDWKTGVDPQHGASESSDWTQSNIRAEHLKQVQALKALTGLDAVHTARVIHRGYHCYGITLRHSEGWSVTYSGDTRPAPELIAAGQNSTLLIHEATLEDSQLEMAKGKSHSTFGEAIRVGKRMKAQNILLTHFSQRYPKMAKSSLFADSAQGTPIALAFDMVTYPLSQFSKIQSYTPAMEALFAADLEEDGEEAPETAHDEGVTASKPAIGKIVKDEPMDVEPAAMSVTALSPEKMADAEQRQPRAIRKAFKPSEWKYLGICLSLPSSASDSAAVEPNVSYVAEMVRSAQTSAMGVVGGSYPFDILAIKASSSRMAWNVVLRTLPSHAADLAAALAVLPSPTIPAAGGSTVRVRLSVIGPATSVQTLQSLFI